MQAAMRQSSAAGPRHSAAAGISARGLAHPVVGSRTGAAAGVSGQGARGSHPSSSTLVCRAERKEYYSYKDMPPLPLTVTRISLPQLGYTVVDESTRDQRLASLAIFYDIYKDDQYRAQLNRRSALTAMCMYDKEDVEGAQQAPGAFPNLDLLLEVYSKGLEYKIEVEEYMPK